MDEPKNRKTETDKRNIFIVRNLINGAIIFILAVFCYEVEYPEQIAKMEGRKRLKLMVLRLITTYLFESFGPFFDRRLSIFWIVR